MESLSANLWAFLHSIDGELTGPQKKFLRDGLVGLLNRQSDIDEKLKAALPDLWRPRVEDNTSIILDLPNIAKPLARKMDCPATVRDASTGQLVNGYWLVELYASVTRKNPVPILLKPFSHEQPSCRGQNSVIVGAVRNVPVDRPTRCPGDRPRWGYTRVAG